METILHDVPTPPGDYILDVERLRDAGMVVSCIRAKKSLAWVDLSTKGLKRMGLRRTDLIDTPVTEYASTRSWAERLHAGTTAQGLLWTSRQDDDAKAMVLFGDRIAESAFKIEIECEPACEGEHLDALLRIAEHIGVQRLIGL